ncbi:unnamed protein product [Pieris macdunnoughi]|uniref:Major facilitator superfamily (MFS) profile domain-containing protein n=1 Tax=Pieris macdunnoughi TaxID=345717 RepID=A0A821S4D1_9NEOP|nr:unnamed protein product [Pieris macdunnoughi]
MCEAKDVDAEETVERSVDLDYVLVNELGQFGRFQIKYILCLIALPIMSSGFFGDYVFTATAIPHRCRIPECGESTKSDVYGPDWITNAIPLTDAGPKFASCERYAPAHSGYNGSLLHCPIDLFDHSITQKCDEFVYDGVTSVVYDFDLACKEWLRTLAGTLSSLGTLLVLPLVGYISDHFGRRMALLFSVFNTALIGVFKAFSLNYTMFLALQLLQTTLGAGLASSAYIFSTELVGPKYRVLTSATSSATFSCWEVVLGVVAWLVRPWRSLLMTLYIPVFLLLSYYWILSESVRWLLAKKKYAEARQVLENVAKTNKTNISAKSMNDLLNPPTRKLKVLFLTLTWPFIPPELTVLRLVVYLAGKFGISLVFTSLYLYTSELYPTEFRHSLLGFSSMVGRIGSICAPLTPLLTDYWLGLPNTVLGLMSGLLVLTQPETFGRKLPDTLEEAETIGK